MDYARKIGKLDEETVIKNIIQTNYKDYKIFAKKRICVQKYKEDNRLANWKKWLKIRQRQHKYLSRATNRLPEELVLNSSEKHYSLVEMRKKMYIVNSTIDTDPVKLRCIEPGFWRTYEFLPEKLQTDKPYDLNEMPDSAPISITLIECERKPKLEVTRNIIPDVILKEKNLEQINMVNSSWKKSKYLKKQIEKASPKIISSVFAKPETTQIYVPDLIEDKESKTLIVQGKELFLPRYKIKTVEPMVLVNTSKFNKLPLKDISELTDEICKCSKPLFLEVKVTTNASEKEMSDTYMKNLIFTEETKESKHIITLENIGDMVILYQWREISPTQLKESYFQNAFIFNKNAGKILPHDKVFIPVWFKKSNTSKFPRIFIQFWCLETKPEQAMKYIFKMWGISKNPVSKKKNNLTSITEYLDNCIKYRTVQKIIDGVLLDVCDICESNLTPEPPFETFFIERELFEVFNKGFFYHRDKMNELRKISLEVDNSCWDLSLKNLRSKIIYSVKNPETRHELLSRFYAICKCLFKPCIKVISIHPVCFKPLVANFLNCFEKEHEFIVKNCFIAINIHSMEFEDSFEDFTTREDRYGRLYKEIFYIRILSRLKEMINKLCAAIDSVKNLSSSNCSYLDKSLIFEKKTEYSFPGVKLRKNRFL